MSRGNTFVPIEFVQLFHHILGLLVNESLVDRKFMATEFWAKWRKKFVNSGQKNKKKDTTVANKPGPANKTTRGRRASNEDDRSFVGVESTDQERVNMELVTNPVHPPTLDQEIEATKAMSLKEKKKLLTTRSRRTPSATGNKKKNLRCLTSKTIIYKLTLSQTKKQLKFILTDI